MSGICEGSLHALLGCLHPYTARLSTELHFPGAKPRVFRIYCEPQKASRDERRERVKGTLGDIYRGLSETI